MSMNKETFKAEIPFHRRARWRQDPRIEFTVTEYGSAQKDQASGKEFSARTDEGFMGVDVKGDRAGDIAAAIYAAIHHVMELDSPREISHYINALNYKGVRADVL